jgi:hypothetical protein
MISPIKGAARRARAAHPLLHSAVMNKLLALGLSLPLVACVIGSGPETGGGGSGGSNGSDLGPGPAPGGDHIAADTMWTGTMNVTATTTVDAGVKLTIAPGTTVKFGPSGAFVVKGTLDIPGTKAQVVNLVPATTGDHFVGITVSAGGTVTMNYAVWNGGAITVDGGSLKATNSRMSRAPHDLLVVLDGKADVSYSSIGLDPDGGADTTHCDLHFGGSGSTIKVTHSNISTSTGFGLMLYGGNNVDLTFNNWSNNPIQVQTQPGVSADFSSGFFDKGAPSPVGDGGATLTYNTPATNRLPVDMAGPQ